VSVPLPTPGINCPRTCLHCGASLNGRRSDAIYCSKLCRQRRVSTARQERIRRTPVNLSLTGSELTRFVNHIKVDANGCWVWQAGRHSGGYGQFHQGGRALYAHRVAYTTYRGPIPEGLELDHLCRNPPCVNPAHLEPVTHQQNMARGLIAQKTHCAHGHPFTPETTYIRRNGKRMCRVCQRASLKRWYAKKRQAA